MIITVAIILKCDIAQVKRVTYSDHSSWISDRINPDIGLHIEFQSCNTLYTYC